MYPLSQPAQQTSLAQQGHGLLPQMWTPQRGLILRSSLPMLPADAFSIAQNVRWNGIVWTTQKIGWQAVRTKTFGNGAIVEQAVHWTAAGAQLYVHQAGTQVQTYDPTTPLTPETTIFTAGGVSIPCMRSFSPAYFIYVNGIDQPQFWTGTGNFAPLTVWNSGISTGGVNYTAPSLVESFNNRIAYAGMSQNRMAVIISDFGNPNSVTIVNTGNVATNGGIYFVPSQLGPVTSLKSLQISLTSNQQVLMVGCQNGFAIISGLDSTSFTMVPVQSNKWGIPSNRAWFTIDTNAYTLCTDGIRPFSSNTYLTNLVSSCLSFPVHPLITGINTAQGSQIFCQDNPSELEANFYFSSSNDVYNRSGLVLNYGDINSGLVRFTTKNYPSTGNAALLSPACGVYFKGNYYSGGFDGILQQQYNGNTFNGFGAPYQVGSPLFPASTPAQEASGRGFWIIQQGDTTLYTAQAFAHIMQQSGQLKRAKVGQQMISFNTGGNTTLGSWTLGAAQFGGPAYNISQFSAPGGAHAWEVVLNGNTANGDLNLVGIFSTLIGGGTRQ